MENELGWPDERIYSFAAETVKSAEPNNSPMALRNDQMKLIRSRVIALKHGKRR
jgi:hypothetical protein